MFAVEQDFLIQESVQELEMLDDVVGEQANVLRAQKNKMARTPSIIADGSAEIISYEDEAGMSVEVRNIRKIGSKTFYLYNNLWVESTVSEKEIVTAINIKKFSPEYFKISNNQSAKMNTYLSDKEEVVVRLNGVIYLFNN